MKPLNIFIKWHCKPGGGLFVGFRCHFVGSVVDDNDIVYRSRWLAIGFLVCTLHIEWNIKTV